MIKGPGECEILIYSPLEGELVPIAAVNDPAFSQEIVGRVVSVRPSRGRIVSPFDGEVSMMFRTGHAVALTSSDGAEVLVHVGLDTVKLKGTYFTVHAHNGDRMRRGDLLIEFDMKEIAGEGYDLITPVVVTNHEDYKTMRIAAGAHVAEGNGLIRLGRKP